METNSIAARVVLALLLAGTACAVATTDAQEAARGARVLFPTVDRGFLFVDGEHVPRPYEFHTEGDAYFVNDINLGTLGIDLSMYEEEAAERLQRRDRKEARGKARDPFTLFYADLNLNLYTFDTVLLVPRLSPVFYEGSDEGGDLLRVLVDDEQRAAASINVPDWKSALTLKPIDQQRLTEHLSAWLASFQPSTEFLADASARIKVLDSSEAANDSSSAATLRLANFGYPLTIIMMILVVLGFGHLLSHRPGADAFGKDSTANNLNRSFIRSLMLIAGLSAIDLVWTILVSQAGAMRELNPIGSEMMENPVQLVFFKVMVTSAAITLLYACRRVALAHQASWWCCLVLTLVAARWLVFNSMFLT